MLYARYIHGVVPTYDAFDQGLLEEPQKTAAQPVVSNYCPFARRSW
jgi:hypothetical protein